MINWFSFKLMRLGVSNVHGNKALFTVELEIEQSKVTRWNGKEEFWQNKSLFFACSILIPG